MMSLRMTVLMFAAVATASFAASDTDAFRWARALDAGELTQDEILGFIVDANVYASTRADYADLRVVDGTGSYVPYVIEKMTSNDTVKLVHEVTSEVDGIEKPADNQVVFNLLVTATNEPLVFGINIDTPLRNFERRVSVFGRSTGGEWMPLVTNALLYDYSQFIDLRETSIRLPPSRSTAFRVQIDEMIDEKESPLFELERTFAAAEEVTRTDRTSVERRALRINRISLWTETQMDVVRVDRKTDYPVGSFSAVVNEAEKVTEVTVETHREPLTSLTIAADRQNFNRRALVQVPSAEGARKSWRTISAGTVTQIGFRDFRRTEATLTFPETRADTYRIVIENRDNPPLLVTGVTAVGNQYQATFLGRPGGRYELRYGDEAAVRPDYDAAAILGSLRSGYAPRVVTAGELRALKAGRRFIGSDFVNGGVFFGLVVGLVIVTLATALFRAGKRAGADLGEGS